MTGTIILTENLTKCYGGEVFRFLGPNGTRKTTTIRLRLDLIRPTSGNVEVSGMHPRPGGPQLRDRIGYLPGELALVSRLSPFYYYLGGDPLRSGFNWLHVAVPAAIPVALLTHTITAFGRHDLNV